MLSPMHAPYADRTFPFYGPIKRRLRATRLTKRSEPFGTEQLSPLRDSEAFTWRAMPGMPRPSRRYDFVSTAIRNPLPSWLPTLQALGFLFG